MERFHTVDNDEIERLIEEGKSKNTDKNTRWALGTFEAWRIQRNSTGNENIPDLLQMSTNDVNSWLARFVVEVRRVDGKEYPAHTLYQICCGISRHLLNNGFEKHILRNESEEFRYFQRALDAKCKDLTKKGIGMVKKKADAICEADEQELWKKRIFSDDTAENLQYMIYFYNCKLFGLRGRDEHRELRTSQFFVDDNSVRFVGRNNKTFNGGIKDLNFKPKDITHYDDPNFSISKYYRMYLNLVGEGSFYKRPLPNIMNSIRYSSQVVGINTLSTIIPKICALAGFHGNYTSHSGKVTTVTQMYNAGIPEHLIQKRTGPQKSKYIADV